KLDCTDQARWEEEARRLRALLDRPEPALERLPCPYPGMEPFGLDGPYPFYGRGKEVQDLLELLRLHPLLVVVGASGSGKSSLVFAGLVPELQRGGLFGPGSWLVWSFHPGQAPGTAGASLLERLETRLGGGTRDDEQARDTVQRLLEEAREGQPVPRRLLLVID